MVQRYNQIPNNTQIHIGTWPTKGAMPTRKIETVAAAGCINQQPQA